MIFLILQTYYYYKTIKTVANIITDRRFRSFFRV